jgi:hypothetical protein
LEDNAAVSELSVEPETHNLATLAVNARTHIPSFFKIAIFDVKVTCMVEIGTSNSET